MKKFTTLLIVNFLLSLFGASGAISSDTIEIVAIGASNTTGKGVGRRYAWPAQLEAMLRKKGYAVRILNRGINGNTTAQMLSRLNRAVGAATQLAILSIPLTNDRRRGANTNANVAAMKASLSKKGIGTIVIDRPHRWAGHRMQSDGIHFTVEGHRMVAAKLLPMTVSLIEKLE